MKAEVKKLVDLELENMQLKEEDGEQLVRKLLNLVEYKDLK